MKTINVKIEGVTPLLINRFKEVDEQPEAIAKRGKKDYGTPRHQAELTAYKDEASQKLWVPSTWISGALTNVSSDYKAVSSKKSLKSIIGGTVTPTEEKLYFCEGYHLKDIEVDSRPVVIQRARVMKHRARLEKWSLAFSLQLDDTLIEAPRLHELLTDAGRRSGLGDFRPPKGGPFGKFNIVSWEVLA